MTESSNKNGIEVIDATVAYGDFIALKGVSVTVPDGSMTALLGPSGSGKSTLLRAIAGLETPAAGTIRIAGQDQTGTPVRSRNVGFVFQHYAAFKHMTVFDNVAFGPKVRKWPRAKIKSRVEELLDLVQLNGLAKRYPSQLSGGQRQRMALARALAVEPKVLLLDEPFGALDAKVRKDLRTWLRRLHDEVHVTTIFVTHDQEEAMDIAEQIVVMNDGRIEQTGSATELYDQPENDFVMGFVGEVNRIDGRLVRPHDVEILPVRAEGTVEADIDRIVELGFSGRVEMVLTDGEEVWAQLTRSELESLRLEAGQHVHIRPRPGAVTREDNGAIDQTISDQAPAASHRPTPAGSGLPV
jgi:sulfate transport system ATP-binding protein